MIAESEFTTVKKYNYDPDIMKDAFAAGANFKRQFDIDTYKQFFEKAEYKDVDYFIVDGRMPCAVAIITKQ